MKLSEAWRLSRVPYREVVYQSLAEEKGRMWWGAFGSGQPGKEEQSELELTNRALRIAKFDKSIVSIFNVVVAVAPFAALLLGVPVFGLASSIALSLAVTLGFTILYAIQTLSSFVSSESSVLLSILPVARDDFSLITLLSFIRSVDYMVLGSVVSQVVLVAFLTSSPLTTLIMLVAAAMNQMFAVAIALWFSNVFRRNLMRGGVSKANTFLRLGFILMWGLLLLGVGLIFVLPWYTLPNLEGILFGFGNISGLLLNLLYPFSTGTLIASITCSSVTSITAFVSSLALTGYVLIAIIAGKWSLKTVKSISQGAGKRTLRVTAKDFSVKTHNPLFGYVLKDLKVASRNPATAFFFALPVLETLMMTFFISSQSTLRTAMLLDATSMGAIFALLIPLALLTAEGKGLEYTKTLPISSRRIVISKTLLSTATYILVPIALMGLSLVKPLTSFSSILIPFLTTISVASASIFEIKLFLRTAAKSKIGAVVNDLEKLIVGALTVLIPIAMYSVVFLLHFNHALSLLVMALAASLELTTAVYWVRRP
jgi:predicted permease